METKRCQRCHKLLRLDAQVCSLCGGHDFIAAATRSRQTVKLPLRQVEASIPSNPPASPHRAGHYSGLHPEDQPYQSSFLPVLRPPIASVIISSPVLDEPEAVDPFGEADAYMTMPEPYDPPIEKRRIATFTPLPQLRQQRGPQVVPPQQVYAPEAAAPTQEEVDVEVPTPPTLPMREPSPLAQRPVPRKREKKGGIIPILLALSCFLFLIATTILTFLLLNNKPVPAAKPILNVYPSLPLRATDLVIISGSGFPANDQVWFTHDGKPLIDQNGKKLEVNVFHSGNFSIQIQIPENWPVGHYTIDAVDQHGISAPVTITIEGPSPAPPKLLLSASQIDEGADKIGAVTHESLTLTNTGGGLVQWKANSDAAWLTASPNNGKFSGRAPVDIGVNRGTLAAQQYTGHLTFTQLNSQSPISLPLTVSMTVIAPPTPTAPTLTAPNLALSSAALTFSSTPFKNPVGQMLTLQNIGQQALNWTAGATTTGGGNWLLVSPSNGTLFGGAQSIVTVSAVTTGLSAGNYSGTVTFSYAGSFASVEVTLTVALPPAPALAVQPGGGLTFNSYQGQDPPSQSFTISNPGTAPLNWGISEDANGSTYAQVSAKSGTLAAGKSIVIFVTPSIAQLSAATIKALITVYDTDKGTTVKSQQVALTFVIINQAAITLNLNQISFGAAS
ncbi:MAG TPA: hypothetical protein VGT44_02880, partial [Ktedonobacteraceae bacterium]|nr:hypothetical protein [Ktedonobacteraceae bacterium]